MTVADFAASTAELRALALEVRYELLLMLDLDPEDADLHRELVAIADEAVASASSRGGVGAALLQLAVPAAGSPEASAASARPSRSAISHFS
jgi:hypothetical protein